MKALLTLLAISTFVACIPPAPPKSKLDSPAKDSVKPVVVPAGSFDINTVKTQIDSLNLSWSRACKIGDVSYIMSIYDRAAHLLPDGDYYYDGTTQIETYWTNELNNMRDYQLQSTSLEGTEDVIYQTGIGVTSYMKDFKSYNDTVKRFTVWKKQAQGGYKIMVDAWNNMPGRK